MSRNFTVLGKSGAAMPLAREEERTPQQPVAPAVEYAELINRLFQSRSAVAVIGSGVDDAAGVCGDIATEVAGSGKRVVVVSVAGLLAVKPEVPAGEASYASGPARNVWQWPPSLNRPVEFFRTQREAQSQDARPGAIDPDKWLDSLRRSFDSVLLSCPALDPSSATGVLEIAAMADMAVLVVEAGRTPKQRIQQDQRALQTAGVKMAGSILVRRRL